MTSTAATIAALAVLTAGQAHAACDIGSDDLGFGFVIPARDCATTLHFDVTTAGYLRQHDSGFYTRVGGELGALMALGGGGGHFHIGPVVALAFGGWHDGFDGELGDVVLSPRARARLWMLDDWMTFEAALGPSFAFSHAPPAGFDRRDPWPARPGFYAEVGPTLGGALGIYVATEYASAVDDRLLGEVRTLFGVRTTLSFGALAALLGGAAYGCSRSPGAC
jgi:hypothetical protein